MKVFFDCFVKEGDWSALIVEFKDIFSAAKYKEGRFAAVVPGTRKVIQLVGKIRMGLNHKGQITDILDRMVIEVMKQPQYRP